MSGWTRDANGEYIDWTKPPYKVGGVIDFRLPGEDYVSHDNHTKRIGEYMKLIKRPILEQGA